MTFHAFKLILIIKLLYFSLIINFNNHLFILLNIIEIIKSNFT
jgi:hypothetical protein